MIIFNGICNRDGYEENTLYDKKYSYSIFINLLGKPFKEC